MTPLVWNENRGAEPAARLLVVAGDAAPRRKHVSHRARRGSGGVRGTEALRRSWFCNNASFVAITRQNDLPSVVASNMEARRGTPLRSANPQPRNQRKGNGVTKTMKKKKSNFALTKQTLLP